MRKESQFLKQAILHPDVGKLALKHSLIWNIRFLGSYIAGSSDGVRSYSRDSAADSNIWTIVRHLFPSNGGRLSTTSNVSTNVAKTINTAELAVRDILMWTWQLRWSNISVASRMLREQLAKYHASPEEIEERLSGHAVTNTSGTRKRREASECRNMFAAIYNVLHGSGPNEKREGYPKYVIEQIILAHIAMQYSGVRILDFYDDELFGDQVNPECVMLEIYFLNDNIHEWRPYYGDIQNLISNGCVRLHTGATYSDCTETTIRHIVAIFRARRPNVIPKVDEFFNTHVANNPNNGSVSARTLWADVFVDVPGLHFRQQVGDFRYELKACFENIVTALIHVFQLDLIHLDTGRNLIDDPLNMFALIVKYFGLSSYMVDRSSASEFTYGTVHIVLEDRSTLVLNVRHGHANIYFIPDDRQQLSTYESHDTIVYYPSSEYYQYLTYNTIDQFEHIIQRVENKHARINIASYFFTTFFDNFKTIDNAHEFTDTVWEWLVPWINDIREYLPVMYIRGIRALDLTVKMPVVRYIDIHVNSTNDRDAFEHMLTAFPNLKCINMYVSIDMRIAEAFANIEYCVIELSRGNPKVTIVLDHMTSMKYLRLMGAPIIAPIRTSVRIRKLDLLHYVALGQLDLSLLNVDEVDISVDALRNITLPTNLDTLSIQGTASVRDFHFNMLKFDQTQPLAAVLCLENVNFVHYGRYAATVDPVNYGIIMQVNIDKCTGDINFIGDTHVRYIE